ncbi:MAG TPA: hypothetical protein VE981_20765 [Planctomycetota bacterium]|nr:hypothetical protein [Planctomycetota bacterium]
MIRINLLPTEKRKAERTPLPRFLLIASTAAAFFILLFYNLWLLKLISDKKDEITQQREALARLQPSVQEHDKLLAQQTGLQNKVREIESLITRDVEYWKTVNALWDVIHQNPRVWIDDFRILDARAAPGDLRRSDPETKEAVAYGVTMRCHVAGEEVTEMTKFRKALKDNPVLQENLTVINFDVDWRVTEEKDREVSETHSIDFQINMFGLSTKPVKKGAAPPAGAPGAPGVPGVPVNAPQGGAR